MKDLGEQINRVVCFLLLGCLVAVSVAVLPDRNHPFDAIKVFILHFSVLLAVFLLTARAVLTGSFPVEKNLLNVLTLLYLCYNLLSYALSTYADPIHLVNLSFLIAFFFAVGIALDSETRFTYLVWTLGGIVAVSSIYAIFQALALDYIPFAGAIAEERLLGRRVFAFFGSPVLFAAFLVVNLPLLLSGVLTRKGRAQGFFGLCCGLALLSLLLTGTRAALLGLGVSLLLFLALTYGTVDRKRYAGAMGITLILVGTGFFYSAVTTRLDLDTLRMRQYWWQRTLAIARDHLLLGTGTGSFNVYYPFYRDKLLEMEAGEQQHENRLEHAHNEFLEILSDLGVLGLGLFLALLFAFFLRYYRHWNPEKKVLLAGNCWAVVGLLTHNLYSVNLRFPFIALFLWLNLALQPALLSTSPREKKRALLTRGRIVASLALLPLLGWIFYAHSLKIFASEHQVKVAYDFFSAENYGSAEAWLKKALENHGRDKWSRYYLGIIQYQMGKSKDSEETFHQLLELDPNFLQSHYWLGNIYWSREDLIRARLEYQESLRVNNAYGPSYYGLGRIALREEKRDQALEYFEQAYTLEGDVAMRTNRKEALEMLIQLNRQMGNLQEASDWAQKLQELEQAEPLPEAGQVPAFR